MKLRRERPIVGARVLYFTSIASGVTPRADDQRDLFFPEVTLDCRESRSFYEIFPHKYILAREKWKARQNETKPWLKDRGSRANLSTANALRCALGGTLMHRCCSLIFVARSIGKEMYASKIVSSCGEFAFSDSVLSFVP
jgi:hypothetical protein